MGTATNHLTLPPIYPSTTHTPDPPTPQARMELESRLSEAVAGTLAEGAKLRSDLGGQIAELREKCTELEAAAAAAAEREKKTEAAAAARDKEALASEEKLTGEVAKLSAQLEGAKSEAAKKEREREGERAKVRELAAELKRKMERAEKARATSSLPRRGGGIGSLTTHLPPSAQTPD